MDAVVRKAIVRRLVQIIVFILFQGAALFAGAGRMDWVRGWACLGIYLFGVVLNLTIILPKDPDLIAERGKRRKNIEAWDRWPSAIVGFFGPILISLIAGLDERFGWMGFFAPWVMYLGLILGLVSYILITWTMISNPFFSGVVRIQDDRGHKVAQKGPYGVVRHPGYAGFMLLNLAATFILGSTWAQIPMIVTWATTIYRTHKEDNMLRESLEGYEAYAGKVRWRLIPGVW